jgi:predicted nucleic acid-binding protein
VTLPLVVADASVVLKWFHAAGEEAVEPARAILEAFAERRIDLVILDLTIYEIGNVLLRSTGASPEATATVLEALTEICEPVALRSSERMTAARLARDRRLTFYDAAYAAVAQERGGRLVTMDRELLAADLGVRPELAFGPIAEHPAE